VKRYQGRCQIRPNAMAALSASFRLRTIDSGKSRMGFSTLSQKLLSDRLGGRPDKVDFIKSLAQGFGEFTACDIT
jgi:hypothetical protein